jgi:hypothetical protein
MDNKLYILEFDNLTNIDNEIQNTVTNALESGKVLYLPNYYYSQLPISQDLAMDPSILLSESILDGRHKNISFNYRTQQLGGFNKQHKNSNLALILQNYLSAFAEFSKNLIDTLLPAYQNQLLWGRTSYRPAEIRGRGSSKRKDDTRLHVDAFPSTPVHGQRILRIFCNINPYGEPRVWNLGEPYSEVLRQFAPTIPSYKSWIAKLLHVIKATKTIRSAYDHYQLHLHDSMKLSDAYQKMVKKSQVDFAALSTWIVFTDQVSHAALSGQFLLEQTFYLPVEAMQHQEYSPLKCLENAFLI